MGLVLCSKGLQTANAAELGEAAAPLQIASWVKGGPVSLAAEKDKRIVVVEFWATWCGPCRVSIPHLTQMQKKFKDVVFVGVSDEETPTVKKFVHQMGDKMDYAVAIDDGGKTTAGYMGAFGISGIPHAFVVDKQGRIVWVGHPMDQLEETLAELVAGKFDLERNKKRDVAKQKLEGYYQAIMSGKSDSQLEKETAELLVLDKELDGIIPGKKFDPTEVRKLVKFRGLLRDYQMASMAGNSATNLARLEKLLQENAPKEFDLVEFKGQLAFDKSASAYLQAAAGQGKTNELEELAKQVYDNKPKNPRLALQLAWMILDDERIKTRDYQLAAKLARAAAEATENKDLDALHVYARALFDGGDTAQAIVWQKKAIASAGDNTEARSRLEEKLKEYEAKTASK